MPMIALPPLVRAAATGVPDPVRPPPSPSPQGGGKRAVPAACLPSPRGRGRGRGCRAEAAARPVGPCLESSNATDTIPYPTMI